MRIAIIGFGREGKAIFDYLKKSPKYKKAEIAILDKNGGLALPKGVFAQCGARYLADLHKFDLVFRSPGVPYMLPEIQHALGGGVKIGSATKLFFESANRRSKGMIIGVTGAKGKGTVSTLLYNILKANKRDAYLAGNIGTPALNILPKLKKNSITVFELSSFQLQDMETSPDVAVVLDIFPDHMDSHGSFNEYVDAKANIAKYQRPGDAIFYSAMNAYSRHIAMLSRGKKHGVQPESFRLFARADVQIPGEHNFRNAVMAATVALSLGVPKNVIVKTVKKFKGLPHRLEFVRCVEAEKRGKQRGKTRICFYNDSGGTNPNTAAAAVKSFSEPLVLIAGGKDKNLDYAPLRQAIAESPNVKAVILIGENKTKIHEALRRGPWNMEHGMNGAERETKITEFGTLNDAVHAAYKSAKSLVASGYPLVTVAFSPGAASFDMFRDYADRGEQFKKIVKAL